jgi:saccharopepsin
VRWHPAYLIDWDEQYDSALGLARFYSINTFDDFNSTWPLQRLIEQKALDRNMFALKHPRTDNDTGELILGGRDTTVPRDSLITLPLLDIPQDSQDSNFQAYAYAGWNVEASSLHLGAYLDSPPLVVALGGYIAVLTNSYANMMFPGRIARQIAAHLNAVESESVHDLPCEARHHLPNFTIALGPQGHEFELSPWQYMHEVVDPEGRIRCVLPFDTLFEDDENPDYVLLGAAFVASWYAEFDVDHGTVGSKFECSQPHGVSADTVFSGRNIWLVGLELIGCINDGCIDKTMLLRI